MNIDNWTKTRKITVLFIAFAISFALSAAFSQAYIVQGNCINDTTLNEWTDINIEGADDMRIDFGNVTCPYGCLESGSAFGDDCAERPINNSAFNIAIWLIAVSFAIGAWRMKYSWGAWTGSILMLALSLWFMWYTSLVIGMIPFAVAIMMLYQSIGLSTKGRR